MPPHAPAIPHLIPTSSGALQGGAEGTATSEGIVWRSVEYFSVSAAVHCFLMPSVMLKPSAVVSFRVYHYLPLWLPWDALGFQS